MEKGNDLVNKNRYFTIWAPRQTGKSAYFMQLAGELEKSGYKVAHINFENYKNEPVNMFLQKLCHEPGYLSQRLNSMRKTMTFYCPQNNESVMKTGEI